MTHFQAQALASDSKPGELERLLGVLVVSESALLRVREQGKLWLDRRQPVLSLKEVQ